MIHLKDINKTYHNGAPLHVLKGINLDIEKGEFVSIMGASGYAAKHKYKNKLQHSIAFAKNYKPALFCSGSQPLHLLSIS